MQKMKDKWLKLKSKIKALKQSKEQKEGQTDFMKRCSKEQNSVLERVREYK